MKNKDSIVAKWISGELDEAELQSLLGEEELPGLMDELDELKYLYEESGKMLQRPEGKSGEDRWQILEQTIRSQKTQKPTRQRFLQWASVAALLVFSLAYVFFLAGVTVGPADQITEVVLPDGSNVTLNAESSLRYNRALWIFNRHVDLTGEAYFQVEKNRRPFTVSSYYAITQVLGTSFNIDARIEQVEIACLTGTVQVYNQKMKKRSIVLENGEGTRIFPERAPGETFPVRDREILKWTGSTLTFEAVPLREVLLELEEFYAVEIQVGDEIRNVSFTGTFEEVTIEEALDIITLSAGYGYEKTGENRFKVSEE